jgi:hypothetical protein
MEEGHRGPYSEHVARSEDAGEAAMAGGEVVFLVDGKDAWATACQKAVHRLERAHWVAVAQVDPAAVDQGHVGCHTCGVHEGSVLHAIGMGLLTR